jgi:glycosyltransferase involved in cell wall biosynthesis
VDVAVLIPALNEAQAIGRVIDELRGTAAGRVLVVDNGSTDGTAEAARAAGAEVVAEPRRGYGSACLRGIAHYRLEPPDILVFLDGDYSDHPSELDGVIAPILEDRADLVVGSRVLGGALAGALTPQARWGNWLACQLIARLFGVRFTDLGPFRAIRWEALRELDMGDPDFGWTVEMQVKAAKRGLRTCEVPVSYRPRIGRSKISGTVMGSIRAGRKILWTIARERWGAR